MWRRLTFLIGLLIVGAVFFATQNKPAHSSLTVYCAAGMKKPIEQLAEQYRTETGIDVSLQFGGTGTLLTQLRVAKQGDLLIAADEGSLAEAQKLGVIQEVLPLAIQHPVIAVAKGNPKNIRTLADLERADVRVALPNPEAASIGKVTQKLLGSRWQTLAEKATVMKPSVTEIIADVKLGTVDAGLVWDSLLPQFAGLEAVLMPEISAHEEKASTAVLTSARSGAEALRFARYLAAPATGGVVFQSLGFHPVGSGH